MNEEQATGALASVRRTGLFASIVGILDIVIISLIVALHATQESIGVGEVLISVLPAILALGAGLKIRQISLESVHTIERVLEITTFTILGFLVLALVLSRGSMYTYPLLPSLLVGSMTKSITTTKKTTDSMN